MSDSIAFKLTHGIQTRCSSYMLLIPQPDGANLADIRRSDRDNWLLLDRWGQIFVRGLMQEWSYISTDGSTCNKVGTSFAAFRYQTDGCFRAPQVTDLDYECGR
eukprot:scaffold161167_cov21-Tisochrysis_lutea.AAC.1